MKGKDLTTNTTIATTHPDNTILTAIVKPRNILIVIGLMAVFILSLLFIHLVHEKILTIS